MTVIDTLGRRLADEGLHLRRTSPRGPGRLMLEVVSGAGRLAGGQWHADPTDAERLAQALRTRFGKAAARTVPGGHVVLQPGGADRRLAPLRRLVARPGSELVSHRPERRAVVRVGDRAYTKVVRPGRTAEVAEPLRAVRPPLLRIPEVRAVDDERGLVTVSTVPGPTLWERLTDPSAPEDDLVRDVERVGRAVRLLHHHPVSIARPVHDVAAELAAARRWLVAASDFGLLPSQAWERRFEQVAGMVAEPPRRAVVVHRDLHDKQVVLGDRIGLLDLDLAAYGDPALDLANLLVHVDLRARQGRCTPARAARVGAAILAGYQPDAPTRSRLPGYAASTRLRLAGVYSFRLAPSALLRDLLDPRLDKDETWQ